MGYTSSVELLAYDTRPFHVFQTQDRGDEENNPAIMKIILIVFDYFFICFTCAFEWLSTPLEKSAYQYVNDM